LGPSAPTADFHRQDVAHAGRTNNKAARYKAGGHFFATAYFYSVVESSYTKSDCNQAQIVTYEDYIFTGYHFYDMMFLGTRPLRPLASH